MSSRWSVVRCLVLRISRGGGINDLHLRRAGEGDTDKHNTTANIAPTRLMDEALCHTGQGRLRNDQSHGQR